MPKYTISGNVGVAGAAVFFVETLTGYNSQQGASAISDDSGNYVSDPLPDGATYNAIPVLFGKEFSPFSQSVTLSGSDAAGIDWAGTSSAYALDLDVSDSFNRGGATQNPISGWTTLSADSDIQSLNNAARATTAGSVSGAYKAGYAPSPDSYAQISPSILSDDDLVVLKLRTDASGQGNGFQVEFWGNLGTQNDAGFQIVDIIANASEGAMFTGPGWADSQTPLYEMNANDAILFVARGANMYAFLNGTPVGAGTSTNSPLAGLTAFEILTNVSVDEAQIVNFVGGEIVAAISVENSLAMMGIGV